MLGVSRTVTQDSVVMGNKAGETTAAGDFRPPDLATGSHTAHLQPQKTQNTSRQKQLPMALGSDLSQRL